MLISDQTVDGIKISKLTPGSEKRVMTKCDICGKITGTTYHNYVIGQERNGNTGKTKCKSCALKISAKQRLGKTPWNKGQKLPPDKAGENHISWKGGRYIDAHGYVMVYCYNVNTKSKWENYKKEHVLVMEKLQGRRLIQGEIVHHINGNKTDNIPSNLALLNNHQEHRTVHNSLQQIGYQLINLGLICFDHESKTYVADLKFREFLEQLDGANQKPSQSGNTLEGSTTRERDLNSQ